MRRRALFSLAAAGLAAGGLLLLLSRLGGRGPGEECPEEPPLVYGREECPVCRMVVDYPPSSAAMKARIRGAGQWFFFDNAGCLAVWHREVARQGGQVEETCVRDRVDGRWVRAEAALFLVTAEYTPMGTGLVAVAPGNLEAYRRGEVRGPWAVLDVSRGRTAYYPPRPGGEVEAVVGYKCLLDRFQYGPAWSVPPGWHTGC